MIRIRRYFDDDTQAPGTSAPVTTEPAGAGKEVGPKPKGAKKPKDVGGKQIVDPDNLKPAEAIAVLIHGVQIAQSKGVYSLDQAEIINKAVKTLRPPKKQ